VFQYHEPGDITSTMKLEATRAERAGLVVGARAFFASKEPDDVTP
jgi:hypothetical protein